MAKTRMLRTVPGKAGFHWPINDRVTGMEKSSAGLTPEAKALLKAGAVVEAVKLTRERTGLGLKEAKDLVDAYLRNGEPASGSAAAREPGDPDSIPPQAVRMLEKGRLIDAIKETRQAKGIGLKDAKETVERYLDNNQVLRTRFKAASSEIAKDQLLKLLAITALATLAAMTYFKFSG